MTIITAVAGPPGIGKTTWIRQQLASSAQPAVYFSPGNTAVPIDQTALATELTTIQTLSDGQESELIKNLVALRFSLSVPITKGFCNHSCHDA